MSTIGDATALAIITGDGGVVEAPTLDPVTTAGTVTATSTITGESSQQAPGDDIIGDATARATITGQSSVEEGEPPADVVVSAGTVTATATIAGTSSEQTAAGDATAQATITGVSEVVTDDAVATAGTVTATATPGGSSAHVPARGALAALTTADAPHLVWPLRLTAAGALQVVEQDTIGDVRQCVTVLLNTPRGVRPLAPEVGVDDPTFTAGIAPLALAADLEALEDRARITITTAGPDGRGQHGAQVRVALAADTEREAP